jgi:hypothetical protein
MLNFKNWFLALCLVTGLAMAGSVGPWFPLPNFGGVVILWIFKTCIERGI